MDEDLHQWKRGSFSLFSSTVISLATFNNNNNEQNQAFQQSMMEVRRSTSLPNLKSCHLEELSRTVNRNQVPTSLTLSNDRALLVAADSHNDFDNILLSDFHQDGALFVPQLNFSFFRDFEEFHKCHHQYDDDPLAGVLNLDAVDVTTACCLQRKLFVDLVKERRDRDKIFTPYGRRLQEIAFNYSNESLAVMTADFWNVQFRDNGDTDITDYFRATFQEIDDNHVEWYFGECSICLAPCRFVQCPPCCHKAICYICWQQYVRTTAKNSTSLHLTGVYNLHCYGCGKLIPYSQALTCTDIADMDLIRPKLHGATTATRCPICLVPAPALVDSSKIVGANLKKQAAQLKKLRQRKGGHPHDCTRCGYKFCRFCGAASHPKFTCKQLTVTEAGLNAWVEQKNVTKPQFKNGRRCPNCNIALSHNGGCPHMTCPCGCEFCYLCGKKYMKPLLGLQAFHTSSKLLPLITCNKLWRSQPKRILVHSLISFGIIAGVVPMIITLTPVALPIFLTVYAVDRCRKRLRHS